MPPRDGIRTYVPREEQKGPRTDRGDWVDPVKLPVLIKLFVWLLVFRAAANLIFALIVGLAPETGVATFISNNFDAWPRQMPPEGVFYLSAALYAITAWRWYTRDWRARWFVMFLSGATAAKMLGNYVADHASGSPTPMAPAQTASFFTTIAMNLIICGYLAFYPGMAQAFKETPWD
ncbi:hypothetical protein [Occallatibacter savannae]|uniref:hypothetical protein n=1 Tax=Occallatibacter savannae TaxID=1002691 RepID=UPI000D69C9A8|nr:hypothetical protein [Occallatibacter savannae]